MKEIKDIVKMRRIPATFLFHCTLCNFEISDYDWHLGLIKMNEHVMSTHPEVQALDKEDLYSRKPTITLGSF